MYNFHFGMASSILALLLLLGGLASALQVTDHVALDPSSGDAVARRGKSSGRFDASCVFFAHVPKTGGSTLFRALTTLAHARAQKLELCYHSMTCETPLTPGLSNQFPDFENDVLNDKCQNNQILYGHGIQPGFAEYHAMQTENAVWVAFIREPMTWSVSFYKQYYGEKKYNGSFEQWVRDGRHKDYAHRRYNQFFLDPHHTAESIEKRAWDWMESRRVLTLFTEDYVNGIRELARFLGATPAEKSAMIQVVSSGSANVRPDEEYNVLLSRASLDRLRTDLKPSYEVYNIALNLSSTSRMQQPLIRPSDQHQDMMEIHVRLAWWDAEE